MTKQHETEMTDRELLELAAKAAGINGEYGYAPDDYYYNGNVKGICTKLSDGNFYMWNPLDDDGDALRLSAYLRLDLGFSSEPDDAVASKPAHHDDWFIGERANWHNDNFLVATRRAIVRAAAEIGKTLK